MKINQLNKKNLIEGSKVHIEFDYFCRLITALKVKELPDDVVEFINSEIEKINILSEIEKKLLSKIRKSKNIILKNVEKKTKFVPIKYHTKLWTLLGMTVFGMPIGMSLSLSLDNFAFIGIGLPIGMAIGMALGKSLDEKAIQNGKQLNIETVL